MNQKAQSSAIPFCSTTLFVWNRFKSQRCRNDNTNKSCVLEGVGEGGKLRENCSRTLFFLGLSMTIEPGSEGRGCLEEGCLGLPGVSQTFLELRFSLGNEGKDGKNLSSLPDLAWNSQTSFSQTSATTRLEISQILKDHCQKICCHFGGSQRGYPSKQRGGMGGLSCAKIVNKTSACKLMLPRMGCTEGVINNWLLRKVLRRLFKRKCFLEWFLQDAFQRPQQEQRVPEGS